MNKGLSEKNENNEKQFLYFCWSKSSLAHSVPFKRTHSFWNRNEISVKPIKVTAVTAAPPPKMALECRQNTQTHTAKRAECDCRIDARIIELQTFR